MWVKKQTEDAIPKDREKAKRSVCHIMSRGRKKGRRRRRSRAGV